MLEVYFCLHALGYAIPSYESIFMGCQQWYSLGEMISLGQLAPFTCLFSDRN